jgi:MoxR-like ATPase
MSDAKNAILQLRDHMTQHILGQERLVDRLLIALLADGHLLVEGAPGLAKTTAIKALAEGVEADFHRLQFTPDLLPGDVIGSDIYVQETGQFEFRRGPIFHNLVLADEINRAPAKVQSALLEAMGERQITVGNSSYQLPELFLVMATQNPIEQEGTYPLPEAQLDRFLLYVTIDYPDAETEAKILKLARGQAAQQASKQPASKPQQIKESDILDARKQVLELHCAEEIDQYMIQLVMATRDPKAVDADLARWINSAASPRATIALDRCARAHAWLAGRDYVSPADVQAIAPDVLRHRILLSFEAEADGISGTDVVQRLIERVPAP